MSNRNQQNSSSTRAGMGTRIKGVFETAHGVGDNLRGRTLGAIDDMTSSKSTESKSHYASLADRGRIEAETGMAHIYGYADPDVYRDELSRFSNSATGTSGAGHTTGTGPGRDNVRAGEDDYYGRNGRTNDGVNGGGGYGMDDGYGRPGAQDLERKPRVDWNTQMDPVADGTGDVPQNRTPQNPGSERMKRDFPPELPPQSQTQTGDGGQRGDIYQ